MAVDDTFTAEQSARRTVGRSRGCPWVVLLLTLGLFCSSLASIPVLLSDRLSNAYLSTVQRQVAKLVRPRFVFVGDSLTANGNWGWRLARNPFAALNLAEDGALIDQIALQVKRSKIYDAKFLFVMAGTNDIFIFGRTADQIAERFQTLIEQVPRGNPTLVLTLIPYTAAAENTNTIRAANLEISRLFEERAAAVIDLNPIIASNGSLTDKFTTDGVHLNNLGYEIWANELRKVIAAN